MVKACWGLGGEEIKTRVLKQRFFLQNGFWLKNTLRTMESFGFLEWLYQVLCCRQRQNFTFFIRSIDFE